MITPTERRRIEEHAYVPEHLPHYVSAISKTEPYLIDDFEVHVGESRLIFVGYPLEGKWDQTRMVAALQKAKERFDPAVTAVIAPEEIAIPKNAVAAPKDEYYRLDLSEWEASKKIRYMLRRARRELSVRVGAFGREHKRLVREFLKARRLDDGTQFIFKQLPEYLKSDSAILYEARNVRGDLVAFDVADFWARHYGFYMFNFRSRKHKVPGASDLLMSHVIERARADRKTYLNLGLGIDAGVAFFKKKWGGRPFLNYTSWKEEAPNRTSWLEAFDQFLG